MFIWKLQPLHPSPPQCALPICYLLQITPESAEHALRDLVFASWRHNACEEYTDTLKLISLVDFFLPFLPLQRKQVGLLVINKGVLHPGVI
jgi:hypothetical protein